MLTVGIDIGTSYSSMAILNENGLTEPVRVSNGACAFGDSFSMPSAIFVDDRNNIIIGQAAFNRKFKNPSMFKGEFKRDLGVPVPYMMGSMRVMPEDCYKEVFIHFINCAERASNEKISKAYITYPANFSKKKIELIEMAAKNAGLLDIAMIDEPTAAGLCYCAKGKVDIGENLLIYDFGGGTFDVALMKYTEQGFKNLVEPLGIEMSGGTDIDRLILDDIIASIPNHRINDLKKDNLAYKRFLSTVQEKSISIKHNLSDFESVDESIPVGNIDVIDYSLSRQKFNSMISPLVEGTLAQVRTIIKKAGLTAKDINTVLAVGGTSCIPYVQNRLSQLFEKDVCSNVDPELAICMGAALFNGKKDIDIDIEAPKTVFNADNSKVFDKEKIGAKSEFSASTQKKYKCSNCGDEMPNTINFCSKCGEVFYYPKSVDEKYHNEYKERIKALCIGLKSIDAASDGNVMEGIAEKYLKKIQRVKAVAEKENLKREFTETFFDQLDTFMEICTDKEFHIAIVGAIKAGKSTLINALLNKDLASVNVTPETAALTKFRSCKDKNYLKVSFYNRREWEELWKSVKESEARVFLKEYNELNAERERVKWVGHGEYYKEFDIEEDLKQEIRNWTSSKCPEHYFVKEVEVGLKDLNIPQQIVYVDTPGLNDPVQYRSEITRKYIDRANVVLVCVKAAALTAQELNTIYRVFVNTRYNPEKVFILGTQVDTLSRPQRDWPAQKEVWLRHLSDIACFNDRSLAEKNLVSISAYLYTLCQKYKNDKSLMDDDEFDDVMNCKRLFGFRGISDDEAVDNLIVETGITGIRDRIANEILSNANKILMLDIKEKYLLCKKDISNRFNEIKNSKLEFVKMTQSNITIEEINKKIKDTLDKVEENKNEKEKLKEILHSIKTENRERVKELFSAIKSLGV